jgi:hypothetical protein
MCGRKVDAFVRRGVTGTNRGTRWRIRRPGIVFDSGTTTTTNNEMGDTCDSDGY